MRNLSMKKFGTPTGAAPGCASEKLGLVAGGGAAWAGGASTVFASVAASVVFLAGLRVFAFSAFFLEPSRAA